VTRIPGLRRLFRLAAGRSTVTDDVADELELHLALRAEELVQEGLTPDRARREAVRRFGDLATIRRSVIAIDREQERAVRRSEWFDSVLKDFRQAFRGLRRSPGFAIGTALTLGLGIALNTAIFSVFEGVVLRPLPFAEQDRLVRIWSSQVERGLLRFSISPSDFRDWRSQNTSFEMLAPYERQQDVTLSGSGDPEQISSARISADVFTLLGTAPAAGRVFGVAEDRPGTSARVVVLGYSLWRGSFAGDSGVLGRILTLNGEPWTVIGVMPEGFFLPGNTAEMWTPIGSGLESADRGNRFLRVLGRLKSGVSFDQARDELSLIARRIEAQYPGSNTGWNISMMGMIDAVVGEEFRTAVTVLLGAVGLVLLIACGNVATMVLGRNTARARELAVRAALGAGTGRLGRLLLAEGLLLGAAGGALGVAGTYALVQLLHALQPPNLPRLDLVTVNGTVLGVAALLAIGSGIVFGLVPLRRASRAALNHTLREGGRGQGGGPDRQRTQRVLVVAEMTLAVLLLSGAGLLIRSLMRLQAVELGFESGNTLAVDLSLPRSRYPLMTPAAFYVQLTDRLQALQGVRAAAGISSVPLGGSNTGTVFAVEGRPLLDPSAVPDADHRTVTPGYFRLVGIPILAGRDFTVRDDTLTPLVVIVSSTTARRHWPAGDALGARIRLGDVVKGPVAEIVGIVGDVRHLSLETPEHRPMIYFPVTRTGSSTMTMLLGTTGEPVSLVPAVRREIRSMDPLLALGQVRTLDEIVAAAYSQRRFNVVVLGLFAVAAVVLAGIGLYGVMAYMVSQRSHELGVRLALGAQRGAVQRMVLGNSLRLVAVGVTLGLAGALILNDAVSSLLFEVKTNDAASLIGAAVLLAGIALLGSYLPARRASRVDPMTTLRQE
jgi:predicted permease